MVFLSNDKGFSNRFKAIMHFISKLNHPTIKVLSENVEKKYNPRTDDYEEGMTTNYRVDQPTEFYITKNLYGKVYNIEKEKAELGGRITFSEVICLEISSKKMKLTEMGQWVEDRLREYNDYIKAKSCGKQLMVEIGYDPKKQDIKVFSSEWKSNVTFDNRFFTDKDNILNKIKFFINNPSWYKERGIPYTMGFLLWGEPGCGKTGFIKALMNVTGRHAISIKLNNQFNMNKLREIVYNDNISEDLIIPQSNRILIFEDIDCMGEIVKDRDTEWVDSKKLKKTKKYDELELIEKDLSDEEILVEFNMMKNKVENYNNNLSYFLNILDGLQECTGRIIVMTTNKPEQLDKALIRPGRIDYNINFTKATIIDIKNILEFYWDEKIDSNISEDLEKKYSHAEVVNMCRISETLMETLSHLNKKLN